MARSSMFKENTEQTVEVPKETEEPSSITFESKLPIRPKELERVTVLALDTLKCFYGQEEIFLVKGKTTEVPRGIVPSLRRHEPPLADMPD